MTGLSSLELNWLRSLDKSLPVPTVVFEPIEECGGYYYRPERNEMLIGERFHDLSTGLIVVSSFHPDDFASTLAHEWRHHWQLHQGWNYDGIGWSNTSNTSDRDAAIKDYFTRSYSEYDALIFEMKKAKATICHDHWREILRLSRKQINSTW